MAVTISTHNGSSVSREHNIRNRSVTTPQDHIDPLGYYEIWLDEKPRQAYQRIFGSALAEYNAGKTRDDRKIKDYYTHIKKDAKKHTVYEMIIGIYGKDEKKQPICPREVGYEIMRQYTDDWKERNPNLKMIGAYYHADEQGEPHVHIDYIPVAHGYRRGMHTQNGLVKALGEMGFYKNGRATAQIQWEARENRYLDALCQQHGLEVVHPEVGMGVEHLHTETYKAQQDTKMAVQERKQAEEERLSALRQLEENKAEGICQAEIQKASERFADEEYSPKEMIIKRTAERKTLFGKIEPATVTISEEDYNALSDVHEIAQRTMRAVESIRDSEINMKNIARKIHRNRIDSHEIAVDERVKTAEQERDNARLQLKISKANERDLRRLADEKEKENSSLKQEIQQYKTVLEFFPDQWESMKKKTARARRLEELYYAYRDGVQHPDIVCDTWTRVCEFDLDQDGKRIGLTQLLDEYRTECDAQGLVPDEEMYEGAEEMKDQELETEWEL